MIFLPAALYKLWSGEQPLYTAFWLFGLLGWWLLAIVLEIAVVAPFGYFGAHNVGLAITLVILYAYTAFVMVGIWRSGTNYARKNPGTGWSIAAKATVIVLAMTHIQVLFFRGGAMRLFGTLIGSH